MFPPPVVEHTISTRCPHCNHPISYTVNTLGPRPPEKLLREESVRMIDVCMNPLCRKPVGVYPMNAAWNG